MTVRPVAVGGVCGLAWAAALRGWMVQLAGSESSFSWLTFLLVLLPGVAVGALLGWAASIKTGKPRWLPYAPALFATALLDPEIFAALIRNGQGGGALIVVATALAGGFVPARALRPGRPRPAGGGRDGVPRRAGGMGAHRHGRRRLVLCPGHTARAVGHAALRRPADHACAGSCGAVETTSPACRR